MNHYEALVVFKPILDIDSADGVLKSVETAVANVNGRVLRAEKVGRKRLAYEIAKFKDGFITTFVLELPSENVADFKKACQLNEDILRLTLVRITEKMLAQPAPAPAANA